MRKPLSEQQSELKKMLDEKLKNCNINSRNRVYQWLNDNRYFADNELFDFYLCVAQNLAAVEILGGSGEKIVKAKTELEEGAEVYKQSLLEISQIATTKQLKQVRQNQDLMVSKLQQEHQKLLKTSTGLVHANTSLLTQQKKLLRETQVAITASIYTMLSAVIILIITLSELWWILR